MLFVLNGYSLYTGCRDTHADNPAGVLAFCTLGLCRRSTGIRGASIRHRWLPSYVLRSQSILLFVYMCAIAKASGPEIGVAGCQTKEGEMSERNRSQLATGAILILLGVGLFVLQYSEGLNESVVLFLIGGLFVAGYLYSRAYGLLIPGCILIGIGLGLAGGSAVDSLGETGEERMILFGLGVGFIALYVIPLVYQRKNIWWPLIPGAILLVVGLVQGNEDLEKILEVGWPLIIVLVGLLILAGAFGLIGRKPADEEPAEGDEAG